MKPHLLLLAALLGLSQCRSKAPDPTPADQLPPATQTGANSFGCLLNGQPWLPAGFIGTSGNYRVTYDPAYSGGSLQINVFKIIPSYLDPQNISIDGSQINAPGNYSINNKTCGVYYSSEKRNACQEYYNAPGLTVSGQLVITRLDMSKGIISGTFDFTLAQPGCDTIKVTQGRFDKQL